MSAEVDTMMSVREMPWHRLGTVVADYPGSWEKARELAGLTWNPTVEEQYRRMPILAEDGSPVIGEDGRPVLEYRAVPDFKYIVRNDNYNVLASVRQSYEVIDHDALGEIVSAVLDTPDVEVKYETMGALNGGARVWVLARLGDPIELPGDSSPTLRYLALQAAHDGKGAVKASATGVRIVCANTWHAADMQADKHGHAFTFRHTKNWRDMLDDARDAVRHGMRSMDRYVEQARNLMELRMTPAQGVEFVREFAIRRTLTNNRGVKRIDLGELLSADTPTARSVASTEVGLQAILASQTCADLEDNAYKYVQSVGEYLDHFRRFTTPDSYFARTVLDAEEEKVMGVNLAREIATSGHF